MRRNGVRYYDVPALDDDVIYKYETLRYTPSQPRDTDRAAARVWVAQAVRLYIWVSLAVILLTMSPDILTYVHKTTAAPSSILRWDDAPPPDLVAIFLSRAGVAIAVGAAMIVVAVVFRIVTRRRRQPPPPPPPPPAEPTPS